MESTPLDVSRDNLWDFFSRTTLLRLFSFESCATFDAIFLKIGCTLPKLCNVMYVIERRLKIWEFSGFVYKTLWKMPFCAKNPFWALKVCYLS